MPYSVEENLSHRKRFEL